MFQLLNVLGFVLFVVGFFILLVNALARNKSEPGWYGAGASLILFGLIAMFGGE